MEREASKLISDALAQPIGKKIKFSYDDDDADIEPTADIPVSPPRFKNASTSTDPQVAGASTSAVAGSTIEARLSSLEALIHYKFKMI